MRNKIASSPSVPLLEDKQDDITEDKVTLVTYIMGKNISRSQHNQHISCVKQLFLNHVDAYVMTSVSADSVFVILTVN